MNKGQKEGQKTAADYLAQWNTGQERWLQKLANKVLDSKRIPEQNFLEEIYFDFCIENGLKKSIKETSRGNEKNQKVNKQQSQAQKLSFSALSLLSLVHVKGVNALKEGESLTFHPNLTVIFGHNGTGKSGYTRILKRLSGSATSENIWSDVHTAKKVQNQCEAKICFKSSGKQKELVWKGEAKISPFTQISVFDGKSVPIYLNQRLEFAYKPYGFELFSILSESVLRIRNMLEEEIEKKESLIDFSSLFHPGTKIYEFARKIDAETNMSEVLSLAQWTISDEKLLEQKLEEQKQLVGIEKQITIQQQEYEKLCGLIKLMEDISSVFSPEKIKLYSKAINNYLLLKKKASEQTKSDLSNFKIEKTESVEWKEFIESAEGYIKTLIDHKHYPSEKKKCIYCQQDLSKEAVELIAIYRELIKSEEENKLKEAGEELAELVEEINNAFRSDYLFQQIDFLQKLLGKVLLNDINSFRQRVNDLKNKNVSALQTTNEKLIKSYSPSFLVKKLKSKSIELKNELDSLTQVEKSQEKKLEQITGTIQNLTDKKKFAENKKSINKCIKSEKWRHKANKLLNKLDTKPITDLGKKAWQSLVSSTFENAFRKERANLSAPEVEISFPAEYGVQKREKFFEGLRNIDEFLSEGEQRAVALSDFLAELEVSNDNAPVVFDDPVNSFDRGRKESLAKRIQEIAHRRQVIVLTHDIIFSSYLFDLVYDENKNRINKKMASFHWLERDNGNSGLVKENDYPQLDKLGPVMDRATKITKKIDSARGSERIEHTKRGYSFLRTALECYVLEKLFGNVIKKWDERLRMHFLEKVHTNNTTYEKVRKLHERFSQYIEGHQHSEQAYSEFPNSSKYKEDLGLVDSLRLGKQNGKQKNN